MLELREITAGYGKHIVLEKVSVSLERGKLTSIIGLNGCGKSTLLKTIPGILPPCSGEILLDGQNLEDMPRKERAKRIAYLSQGKNTPDMTVEQMVLHGRFPHLRYPRRYTNKDREIAFAAMEQAGIADHAGEPLYALSGGMRQSAYIAMALAQGTEYILLDEPTTYLDIAHQLELMKLLRRLAAEGKGIVTVLHDLPMAFTFSDRVVVLHEGAVLADGSPACLYTQDILQKVFGVTLQKAPDQESYTYSFPGK